jgi:hypothetical protein
MSGLLLLVALLQEADYEALLRRYGDKDAALSRKAFEDLVNFRAARPRGAS